MGTSDPEWIVAVDRVERQSGRYASTPNGRIDEDEPDQDTDSAVREQICRQCNYISIAPWPEVIWCPVHV